MKCKAYLIADTINIKALPSEKKLREACYLRLKHTRYVIFPYGVVVCWGDGNLADVLVLIEQHMSEPVPGDHMYVDEFDVKIIDDLFDKLVFEDCIYLKHIDDLELIAISHSIAQSVRLVQIEDSVLGSIEKIKHIPQSLAQFGKIKESKTTISKMQGHLYQLKGKISFEHSVLDKPEFFWEYPEYDHLYTRMAAYMEMNQRTNILDKKMGTIDEILSILSDELNHRHSSKLELIIIFLILFEIIIFFLKDVFELI